jgi:hypothetical protein
MTLTALDNEYERAQDEAASCTFTAGQRPTSAI